MAHHGFIKNPRLRRLMRRKYQLDGDGSTVGTPPDTMRVDSAQKRQQTEDQTKVMAAVISVMDDTASTAADAVNLPSATATTSDPVPSAVSNVLAQPSSVLSDVGDLPTFTSITPDVPTTLPIDVPSTSSTGSASLPLDSATSIPLSSRPLMSSTMSAQASSSSIRASSAKPSSASPSSTRSPTSTPSSSTIPASSTSSATISSSGSQSSTITSHATETSVSWYGGGGSGTTGSGSAPSSTGSPTGTTPADKGKIAGGVVGGVTGAMVLVLVLFVLLRRWRKFIGPQPRDALPAGDESGAAAAAGEGSFSRSTEVASRSSHEPLFRASYFAPAFMRRWRQSTMSTRTDDSLSSTAPSERGFQKISGRKITSVLQSGGDGYSGEAISPTASEQSTIHPPGSPVHTRSSIPQPPPPSAPFGNPLDVNFTREVDESDPIIIYRPSPARTAVSSNTDASLPSSPTASRVVHSHGSLSPSIHPRPDLHSSYDGSRGSRFTETM